MKRFLLITACILLVCAAAFWFISLPHHISGRTAAGGVLDLTGADSSATLFRLDGEWAFYYGQFYTPADFANGEPGDGALIEAPMSWSEAGYPLEGFATYRLCVLTDEKELMLYIPEISVSSAIWANGEKIFEAGQPGRTKGESKAGMKNTFVSIKPEDGEAELIVHVSNHRWMKGGLTQSILIGAREVLLPSVILRLLLLAVFLGALLIIGLYHFILFLHNRRDSVYLIFAAFCVVAAVRFYWEANSFAQLLSADGVGDIAFHMYQKSFILTCFVMTMLTHAAFKIPYGRFRGAVYLLCAFLTVVLPGLVIPFPLYRRFWFLIADIPMILSVAAAFRKNVLRPNPYNALYLLSAILLIVWGFVTKLLYDDVFFVSGVVSHLFLVLSQCVMLSVSYAETKRRERELAAQADFYRRMNHNMRTPLTIVSTNIQTARRRPEEAAELLTASQAEIMKMAAMIDDALKDDEKAPGS